MKCDYCELLDSEKSEIMYQDNDLVIVVKDTALTPGQITIFPKQHFTILEMVPEDILTKAMQLANKVSIAVFESLGAQGTNIVIQNGIGGGQKVPHFCIEVYPRQEQDGLPLQWQPKKLDEIDQETTFNMLTEELAREKKEEKLKEDIKAQAAKALKEEEKKIEKIYDEKPSATKTEQAKLESYLIKSIKRIP